MLAAIRLQLERATPIPVSDVLCDPPGASSVTVRVPDRVPVVVGVKVTLIVQNPNCPICFGQSFVCE